MSISDKPKWLQTTVAFLIDNVSILATLGAAAYIVARQSISTTKLPSDDLATAILGVVGLLALSELIERYRKLNTIDKTTKQVWELLRNRFADHPSALAFFRKLPDFDSYVQGANQIDLCGIALTSTVNRQLSNLREQLLQGAKVRILLVDPDSSTALSTAEARSEIPSIGYYRSKLATTLQDLNYLQQIQDKSVPKGNIEIRLVSYPPSFALYSFDAGRPSAQLFVEIYPHITGWGETPVFNLMPGRDGKWYEYFTKQFEAMWERASRWECKPLDN